MRLVYCFIFITLPYLFYSQNITGSIKNTQGKIISFATILFKEKSKPDNIMEYVNVSGGVFTFEVKKKYTSLLIEIKAIDYETESLVIENPINSKTYTLDFILQKNKVKELEEVVVVAKKRPFTIKKDTITFDISKYRDPSDKKVEDVLKRLPGVEVNNKTGVIKYNGKNVETVSLDGDNLFGQNYSIGTKNIDVDMLEQVEAIENYSENPLLKSLEGDEKVALNLKLKKGKADYSGNLDFGLGFNSESNILNNSAANLLIASSKFKSFSTSSFNNIGLNHSPYDNFSNNSSAEQTNEEAFFTKKILPELYFGDFLDDKRVNRNNMFFSSANNLFKVNRALTVKLNFNYLKDKINFEQLNSDEIKTENSSFTTSDQYNSIKKPSFVRGDFNLKFNSSKTSLIEYKTSYFIEKIASQINVLSNNMFSYKNKLKSENVFFKGDFLLTKKINKNNALQFQIIHTLNSIPQTLVLINSNENTLDFQNSDFKKTILYFSLSFIGNSFKKSKYLSVFSYNSSNTNYNSLNNIALNDVDYVKRILKNKSSINYIYQRFNIKPVFTFSYLNQNINQTVLSKQIFLFEPSLNIKYSISKKSFINVGFEVNKNTFSEEYIFKNNVVTDHRNTITNTPSLEIQNSNNYRISYTYNNLYRNIYLNLGINYQENDSDFFSKLTINEQQTSFHNFYLKEANNRLNVSLNIEKFVPIISSTITLNNSITKSKYKNFVNASDLRNNETVYINNTLSIKTGFLKSLNMENEIQYGISNSEIDGFGSLKNRILANYFKLKYKITKQLFSQFSFDYYVPSTTNMNMALNILDFSLSFSPKSNNYELTLIGKNLLNKKTFSQIQTSDYAISTKQDKMLSRYLYLNFSYSF